MELPEPAFPAERKLVPHESNAPPRIAVIGSGIMGRGIALVAAQTAHRVTLIDPAEAALSVALELARADLLHPRSPHREQVDQVLARITPASNLDAAATADVVIEAVPEDLELKRTVFAQLESLVSPDAFLATNTSALSVSEIGAPLARPERLIGMHFFNPVPRMKLIELVIGERTSEEVVQRAEALSVGLGKVSVRVKDHPGFVTSRINVLIGNEAFRILSAGIASAEDVDTAIRYGLNHPMGPFELVDLVGLDTRLAVLTSLHKELGDRFEPDPTLVRLVEQGRLGRKTGHGVYRYTADGERIDEGQPI